MKRSRRNRALPNWKWVLLRRGNNRRCRQRAGKVGRTTRFLLLSLEKRSHAEGFGDTLCRTSKLVIER